MNFAPISTASLLPSTLMYELQEQLPKGGVEEGKSSAIVARE